MGKRQIITALICLMLAVLAVSCMRGQDTEEAGRDISAGLVYSHSMELDYAEGFSVDYYEDGYTLVSISGDSRFLVVPGKAAVPEDLDTDIVILRQPVNNIYLAASAVMDMFCSMDAQGLIRLSGTKEEGWYIEEARAAMEEGSILYAGKYNAPDYELILAEQCELSIQSTMILHSPEARENLESFGIPVLVDYSSYEGHPLGRTEWIKLYGVLAGKEAEAQEAFRKQKEALNSVISEEGTGKTVAFFYITSNGTANVRKSGDYVPKMIELAGGRYIFAGLGETESASSSVNMQMEEFYAKAKDADYIIYNSTVDGGIESIGELLGKSALLGDFKAVQEGNAWCTTQNLYQDSMKLGTMIADIHAMLTTEDAEDAQLTYLFKLE